MGCIDEVVFECPACKKANLFQSKAGECESIIYGLGNAPLAIIEDMNCDGKRGIFHCEYCGAELRCDVMFCAKIKQVGVDGGDDWRSE